MTESTAGTLQDTTSFRRSPAAARSTNSSTENVVSSSGATGSSVITASDMTFLMENGTIGMPSTTR